MRFHQVKATLKTVALAGAALLLAAGVCSAQSSVVNLTATRQSITLPDGKVVPMWGWVCGTSTTVGPPPVTVSTAVNATCTALTMTNGVLNAQLGGTAWQPPLIIMPTGNTLKITLGNGLPVETSITIVGQLGGGLGSPIREGAPRTHDAQTGTTWPNGASATFTPPAQGQRARSFVPETLANGSFDYMWSSLKPGTYLIETGTYPSIQGPMGLYGVLVVTQAPTSIASGLAYPVPADLTNTTTGVTYDSDVALLFSEIDPVQNASADAAAATPGLDETKPWNPTCGNAHTCYPPAVDFTPLYYTINGVSFDKSNPAASTLNLPASVTTGNVLLRLVNAGLRMHVPSTVGLSMSLMAQDGNVEPDVALALTNGSTPKPKVQSDVFMAAGKVYDVVVNPAQVVVVGSPSTSTYAASFPVFDRELSLSANATRRDSGMLAYVEVGTPPANSAGTPPAALAAQAVNDVYKLPPNKPFSANVLSNDIGVFSAAVVASPTKGTLSFNPDGTFTYIPNANFGGMDSFTYNGNSNTTNTATVTLNVVNSALGNANGVVAVADAYMSNVASVLKVASPGVLANDTDNNNYPLTAATLLDTCPTVTNVTCLTASQVVLSADGSFTAAPPSHAGGAYMFSYHAVNSQGTSSNSANVTITFVAGNGPQVTVQDAQTGTAVTDYRWIIEEDSMFHTPAGVTTPPPQQTLATSFNKSHMTVVANGCFSTTQSSGAISCQSGQSVYDPGTKTHIAVDPRPQSSPSDVHLELGKYYYISVLPGDAVNAFAAGNGAPPANCLLPPSDPNAVDPSLCGHTMGGAPIPSPAASNATSFAPVTVLVEPNPLPTAQLSVFVFEDNGPTNGAVDTLEENQGLGGFQIILNDVAGATGVTIGQMTYDMFNYPLTNALVGTKDTVTGADLCPANPANGTSPTNNLVGMIITCPKLDSKGNPSPYAGQALIKNLFPNKFDVLAKPSADLEAKGEHWIQTSTLEGTHANDAFAKANEPPYFQEFGSPGFHAFIGFVNPDKINAVKKSLGGTNTVNGQVTNLHMSRPSDISLHDSSSHDPLSQSVCFIALNSQSGSGQNIAFEQCDQAGNFSITGVPPGLYELAVWDEWQDQIFEYVAVNVPAGNNQTISVGAVNHGATPGHVPVFSWFQHIDTRTYLDNGIDNPGIGQVPVTIRFRDGQFSNLQLTDNSGDANFTELFPLFNWYVMESDTTRFKGTKVSIINDAGGAVDTGATSYGIAQGFSTDRPTAGILNSTETVANALPTANQVPGAVYTSGKTTRLDPGSVTSEGFQAFVSQPQIIEWGKTPYLPGENGGIAGHVAYATTRPFDDPGQVFQNLWAPLVPGVTVNLYAEGTAPDGTQSLTLIDTTTTSSWDNWVNGTHADPTNPANQVPNMNCPGQETDPIKDPYLTYTLGAGNRYKCYDGFHNWDQIEPAPYDGKYQFPTANCTGCAANPNPPPSGSAFSGLVTHVANILLPGKYVTEVIVPAGYELVKEEDKNILMGDQFIAPAVQQFGPLASIFIVPDQASINAYNPSYTGPVTGGGAAATANLLGTIVSTITLTSPGSKYSTAPAVTISAATGDPGTGATATAVLTGTSITSIIVTNPGTGYLTAPAVSFGNGFNPLTDNNGNPTTNMGRQDLGGFGPGNIVQAAPCVGAMRIIPDFMSYFPQIQQYAPFAGALRPLCNRKEITLEDQMQAKADFFIFTNTPKAAKFSGMVLDDLSAEFNNAKPDFGEKFGVPFVPVAIRDWNGIQVARLYSDQFGMFNGMVYSTWEVNPPNPTGYAPNMMLTCMNDPGPIPDPNNPGQFILDPLYNPQYSNFCYTKPFMPGTSDYLDTPILSVAAFAAGFNPVDCAYPDSTPAIKSVTSSDGPGPWVSATGHQITITALGTITVPNNAYEGPSTTSTGLANQSTITRHYGFCPGGTATCAAGTVTVNGVALTSVAWSDSQITGTVAPGTTTGELAITNSDGKKSVDTVTVTIEAKNPTYVTAPSQTSALSTGLAHPIQDAIDAAIPGDLIILGPGHYPELVIMWQPVRLQGVGAASVIINAAKFPTQRLHAWRTRINGLFGLDAQGNTVAGPPQVDPLPGQEITGGILLLEPSVLSSEEGAGITVVAKNLPASACGTSAAKIESNFLCATSRIDGVSVTGGDGGGGIYVNGWAHNLEIANNRVYGNAGTFTGGVRIGQPYLEGEVGPGPLGYDTNVKMHHNSITKNGTIESNIEQGGAGGGASMCSGTDNYVFNYNFVCGNFSLFDGGGFGHLGLSWNGNISNNWFLFNQTTHPEKAASGGGIAVVGEPNSLGGLSLGTGPNLIIDSNLIQGNDAQSGHGGGIRLENVNGADVTLNTNLPGMWWQVSVTNNMIVNNVAGWSGGGISLSNTLMSSIINNTVASNDSTATAGPVVFTTGAAGTASTPKPAGIVSEPTSAALVAALGSAVPAELKTGFSNPFLENNIIYRNRAFYFTVSPVGSGANPGVPITSHLNPVLTPGAGYTCPTGADYWDLGVLGQEQGSQTLFLNPTYSVLSNTTAANGVGAEGNDLQAHNSTANPLLVRQYCNGARQNPLIPQNNGPYPPFAPVIAVAGTEDESGNWVDLRYGPLSLTDSSIAFGGTGYGALLGDYRIGAGSSALDTASSQLAPNHDIFGTKRPQGPEFDKGAHELVSSATGEGGISVSPRFVDFGNQQLGTVTSQDVTVTNNGTGNLTGISVLGPGGANPGQFSFTHNCPGTLPAVTNNTCTITVRYNPASGTGALGAKSSSLTITSADQNITVRLSATGQTPSGTVLPAALAFTTQLIGTSSVSQPVTVTNTGIGLLVITSITFGGTNPLQFSQAGCGAVPITVLVGGTCTTNVTFAPGVAAGSNKTAGVKNATMIVDFASPLLPNVNVALTGTAIAPNITQVPLAFGQAPPANTTLTAQVNNTAGTGALTITSVLVTAGGGFFTIAPGTTCTNNSTVAAGNNCDVNVLFTQTGTTHTPRNGNLRIITSVPAPGGGVVTFNVALSGN